MKTIKTFSLILAAFYFQRALESYTCAIWPSNMGQYESLRFTFDYLFRWDFMQSHALIWPIALLLCALLIKGGKK
jgi:hypothetical protein